VSISFLKLGLAGLSAQIFKIIILGTEKSPDDAF
jgi:hypothetical protein